MKILLINPPSRNAVDEYMLQVGNTEGGGIGCKPPLGILYIAAYLSKMSSHDVTVMDAQVEDLSDEEIRHRVATISPDVVGITSWTSFWHSTVSTVSIVKSVNPDIHVCLGGPHVSVYPDETLSVDGVDSISMGDGEKPFAQLVDALENGELDKIIPGIYFKHQLNSASPKECYVEKDLDELPVPLRTAVPYKRYSSVIGKENYITTMITSRGCPYRCTYCKLHFQKSLCRSATNVLDELSEIAALGISEVEIYDDTFSWSKQRVIDICRGIVERGLKLRWSVRDRVSNVELETLQLMKKAGCERVHFGVESGSDEILKLVKKNITTAQAEKAVTLAKKAGLEVLTYFMLGLPGETEAHIKTTVDFALGLNADYTTFNIAIPYPGTEMYDQGLASGIIPHDFWSDFVNDPKPNYDIPYLYEENVKLKRLIELRNRAMKRFYLRPSYIVRQLKMTGSLNELYRKMKMGLSIMRRSVGC